MNVTKVETEESTKHCCGNGCCRKDSAEHEGEGRALIDQRITENNSANADRRGYGMLEEIVSADNLNRAYKRVKKNKGAGGVDGMEVDELLQYLRDNGDEIRQNILAGKYQPKPVRRVEIPKDNGKTRKLADMKTLLQSTDKWVRRRIRMVFWKKWKRVRTRCRNLRKLGMGHNEALMTAGCRRGYWFVANTPVIHTALSNTRLERAGFVSLSGYYKSIAA